MNAATKLPKDHIIPSWADEEYPFDTISDRLQESMREIFMDPARKVAQRGRVHVAARRWLPGAVVNTSI